LAIVVIPKIQDIQILTLCCVLHESKMRSPLNLLLQWRWQTKGNSLNCQYSTRKGLI